MSFSGVNVFCKYIEHIIIHDNNISFNIVNNYYDVNILYLFSSKIPNISITNFINELFKSKIIDKESFDEVILYTVNIMNLLKIKGLYLNNLNSHRIILILLLISCKIHNDLHYDNSKWARHTGLTLKVINIMEITILKLLEFNLYITISRQKAYFIYKSIYYTLS